MKKAFLSSLFFLVAICSGKLYAQCPDGMATPSSQPRCSGDTITTIILSGTVPGTIYNWTRDNTVVVTGIAASGAGDISGTLTNNTPIPITVTFTITPVANNCAASPFTSTIIVNPNPALMIQGAPDTPICPGNPVTLTAFTTMAATGTLYTQGGANGNSPVSQNFEDANNAFDSHAAEDFTVPAGATWTITQVSAGGLYFNGLGPSSSYNIIIYNNSVSNKPGTALATYNNVSYTGGASPVMTIPATVLEAGTYWISVQSNLNFTSGGEWAWSAAGSSDIGFPWAWQNPNGGFGTPCIAWGNGATSCVGGSSRNLIFTLTGTSTTPPPTGYTFAWSPSSGLNAVDVNPVTASPDTTTTYTVSATTDAGCTNSASVTITVNPKAEVSPVQDLMVCNGASTTAINFSSPTQGGTIEFNWTNSNPSIGLAASGSGNIPSFNAVKTGNGPVTATITVTPTYTNQNITCEGEPATFTITVNDTFNLNQSLTLNYSQLPYAFGTQTLTLPGTYTETLQSAPGCDSTVTLQLDIVYTIAGKVHNDVNGMNSGNTINGNGTNAGGLKAVLVATDENTVTTYIAVDANGNFVFDDVPLNNYTVLITNSSIIGNNVPAVTLPSGWVHTGEKPGGSDGTADGRLELDSLSQNLSVRFGIQQPPAANNSSLASQLNPGSNASVNLPNSNFNMSDPSPGAVTKVRFTTFPSGTDNLYINGNGYNSNNWPGNVEVNTQYIFGNLLMPNVSIDPTTGPQQVVINYQAIDAAGMASNTATITMPFFGLEIGGMVHNNFQGMNGSPVNTIAGPGTNGGGLYAILSEDISNKVVATQAINGSTGAYQFTGIDQGYYSVRLNTTTAAFGSTAPASSLNSGWKATAEKNGTGAGTDGYADSKISIGLQATNNNNIRFGIQQPPTASPATAASQLNPNGNINYTVPATTFVTSDAAPGAVTSLYFSGALPANTNKLVLNGVTYSATNPLPPAGVHVSVSGGSPVSPILVDPVNGNITVAISYNAVDAAGMVSATTVASQPFHKTAALAGGVNNSNGNATANQEEQGLSTFRIMDIQVYPNPAKDRVYIKTSGIGQVKILRLLDIQGRELRLTEQAIESGLDMSGLAPGTYLLQVQLKNGNSQQFKVVKE